MSAQMNVNMDALLETAYVPDAVRENTLRVGGPLQDAAGAPYMLYVPAATSEGVITMTPTNFRTVPLVIAVAPDGSVQGYTFDSKELELTGFTLTGLGEVHGAVATIHGRRVDLMYVINNSQVT